MMKKPARKKTAQKLNERNPRSIDFIRVGGKNRGYSNFIRIGRRELKKAGEKVRLRRAFLRLARARVGITTVVDGIVYVRVRKGVRRAGRKRKI